MSSSCCKISSYRFRALSFVSSLASVSDMVSLSLFFSGEAQIANMRRVKDIPPKSLIVLITNKRISDKKGIILYAQSRKSPAGKMSGIRSEAYPHATETIKKGSPFLATPLTLSLAMSLPREHFRINMQLLDLDYIIGIDNLQQPVDYRCKSYVQGYVIHYLTS